MDELWTNLLTVFAWHFPSCCISLSPYPQSAFFLPSPYLLCLPISSFVSLPTYIINLVKRLLYLSIVHFSDFFPFSHLLYFFPSSFHSFSSPLSTIPNLCSLLIHITSLFSSLSVNSPLFPLLSLKHPPLSFCLWRWHTSTGSSPISLFAPFCPYFLALSYHLCLTHFVLSRLAFPMLPSSKSEGSSEAVPAQTDLEHPGAAAMHRSGLKSHIHNQTLVLGLENFMVV